MRRAKARIKPPEATRQAIHKCIGKCIAHIRNGQSLKIYIYIYIYIYIIYIYIYITSVQIIFLNKIAFYHN